jgi:2,6-dihydroxypseudooxynicotine hydrolase
VQAGVDYSDFLVTTARIDAWEDWLDTWREAARVHVDLARSAERDGHMITAGEAWVRAAVYFHFARFVWVLDAERSRAAGDEAIAALRRAHELLDPTAERIEADLDGGRIVANLRRPSGVDRSPLVVMIPGLDSTKEEFFRPEQVFLDRGMATLSLDGPGQGEGGYTLPIRPDYEVAVEAILDAIADRGDIDHDRIGAMGVSLGGYYAPRAAAYEPRIKAVVGLSGPFNFGDCWDELPDITRETFVTKSHAADDADGKRKASELDLAGVLQHLDRPFMAITGKGDRLIPWEQTERQANEAPAGEFVMHDDGNHGCANVSYKTRPLIADWMLDRLTA